MDKIFFSYLTKPKWWVSQWPPWFGETASPSSPPPPPLPPPPLPPSQATPPPPPHTPIRAPDANLFLSRPDLNWSTGAAFYLLPLSFHLPLQGGETPVLKLEQPITFQGAQSLTCPICWQQKIEQELAPEIVSSRLLTCVRTSRHQWWKS